MVQKLYDAFLMNTPIEGQAEFLRGIDLFNLPYDRMGAQTPLVILGDVDMGKSKSGQWPDFTHVGIQGTFDCSNFTIGPDTILPGFFTTLICKYSIGDLKVLINMLQDIDAHDCTVVVRSAVLNNIKKNTDGALDIAREFAKIHPSITVTDGKRTLSKILNEIDASSVRVAEPMQTTEPAASAIPLQTKEYLSVKNFVPVCTNALAPDLLQKLSKDLDRYIKQAFSKVSTIKMRRTDDNVVVTCVHRAQASTIIDAVIENIQKDIEQSAKKQKAKSKSPAAKLGKQTPVVDAQTQSCGTKIVPQKIKKYISKSAWKQIQKATGTSKNILLQILQDVQDINIVPTETGPVHYIKDGEETISSNVEFRGKCLSQRFDKTNNRPRIVWGIDGNVFVCQHYFADHGDNDRIEYAETLNKINLDISKLDLKGGFLLVSSLIKNLTKTKENDIALTAESNDSVEPGVTTEPIVAYEQLVSRGDIVSDKMETFVATEPSVVKDVMEKQNVPDATTEDPSEQSAMPVRKKRPRIKRNNGVPQASARVEELSGVVSTFEQPAAPQLTTNTDVVPDVVEAVPDAGINLVSLDELHSQYSARYAEYVARQKTILGAMATATDTYTLINLNEELGIVLGVKREIESAIETINKYNVDLQELRKKLDQYSH